MFTYTDWLAHLEHYEDLRREAEKERLARTALAAVRARKAEKKAKINLGEQLKSQEVACCKTAAA